MNAMALDLVTGTLTDPFGGKADIIARTIRAVGDPVRRLTEDGLRMMRAARFAATLGFKVEQRTKEAITSCVGLTEYVSRERLRDELLKLLGAEKPSVGLRLASDTGLLWVVIPELEASVGQAQNSHHALDVWEHTMLTVDSTRPAAM
jgi:tRNA nucleotidyltransferase/poly(A) polymerase